ncbi:hypothetical protein G3576_30740 [Roseomonas stagni]|uniref:Uncharacterized protein n=1 Tax=Falsiroseomonas algicola TaxID=2716930 RepID=A0A6M1LV63_9PROT|nr:hypothetical protein [Falsiroseomonas algicola]NGM24395.1 hypothetical protein [Falsiroseomonas algicola]
MTWGSPRADIILKATYWLRSQKADGKQVVKSGGDRLWFEDYRMHRLDGPALVYANGKCRWYVRGVDITDDVLMWVHENGLPPPSKWTDKERVFFALRFSDTGGVQ